MRAEPGKSASSPILRRARQLYQFLGSPNFTVILLVLFFVMVLIGTILQSGLGVFRVRQYLFDGWIGRLILLFFLLNLLCSLFQSFLHIRRPFGLILVHLGFILLAFGIFGFSNYYVLGIREGQGSDRIFYSNRWELVLEWTPTELEEAAGTSPLRVAQDLGQLGWSRHRGSEFILSLQGSINGASLPDIRFEVDDFLVNALPDEHGHYVALRWADSPSANLPLLRGRLFIADDTEGMALELPAGVPLEIPLSAGGRLTSFSLRLEPASHPLPFTITLKNFTADFYPDTELPRSFSSEVLLEDGIEIDRRISMNNPLRYRGFVFYQDSYRIDDDGRASIFSVRKMGTALFPYLGTLISCLGFLIHYLSRKGAGKQSARHKVRLFVFFPLFLAGLLNAPALQAQGFEDLPESTAAFSRIGIQSMGRVMPSGSYGSSLLRQVSGRSRIAGMDGEAFLFRLLFDFSSLSQIELVRIYHPDLMIVLGLEQGKHFSIEDLNPAIETLALLYQSLPAEAESAADPLVKEIAVLYENLRSLFLLSTALDNSHDIAASPLKILPAGDELVHPYDPHPRTDAEPWTADFRGLIATLLNAGTAPGDHALLDAELAGALRNLSELQAAQGLRWKLDLERLYRALLPFRLSALILMAGGLLIYLASKLEKREIWQRRAMAAGSGLAIVAIVLASVGFIFRMIISARPPITNLYTSILFLGWLLPLLGLRLASRDQRWLYCLAAGCILLLAPGFLAGNDDLSPVQAVLDSNFWLSVHVLTIVTGYAFVFTASLLGHVQALSCLKSPNSPKVVRRHQTMLLCLRTALLLMFVGTILGGFWADQSWGRFWGWDPKENAALLLILWLSIILHARVKEFTLNILSAASSFVLLFSWIGVNLMAVGLHTYGWNRGTGLFFIAANLVELLFLSAVIVRYKKMGRRAGSAI